MWKNIWCQDLNSRPLDHESPQLTTRPQVSNPIGAFLEPLDKFASSILLLSYSHNCTELIVFDKSFKSFD